MTDKETIVAVLLATLTFCIVLLSISLFIGVIGMAWSEIKESRKNRKEFRKEKKESRKEKDEEEYMTPFQKWLRGKPSWMLYQIEAGVPAEKFGWREPNETTFH